MQSVVPETVRDYTSYNALTRTLALEPKMKEQVTEHDEIASTLAVAGTATVARNRRARDAR